MANDTAMSAACTQRNEVGEPCPTVPADHARGSSQIASANLGQITHVHTPTPTRNHAHRLDKTMHPSIGPPPHAHDMRWAGSRSATSACDRALLTRGYTVDVFYIVG
jgi:hypothetical protein